MSGFFNGLPAVDAVGSINVSANNFSRLFYIRTNDLTILSANTSMNEIKYGVIGSSELNVSGGVNPFTGIPYSNARIHAIFANPAIAFVGNTLLYQDYIRYTSKSVIGGLALSDIFENEGELLEAVGTMNSYFSAEFNDLLNNASGCENYIENLSTTDNTYPYVFSCNSLVTNLVNEATSNTSTSGYFRGQKFLEDLASQSDSYVFSNGTIQQNTSYNGSYNIYWVVFHPGDVMAIRLTYSPQNGSGNPAMFNGEQLGSKVLYDRSYKIYLRMD